MKKYVKKPIEVEAVQVELSNYEDVCSWINEQSERKAYVHHAKCGGVLVITGIYIETLEGDMDCRYGDYIIKGIEGEFYPCRKSIFEKTYDEVKP